MALLYYRTKYDPEEWVTFDKHQLRAVWALGGLRADFSDKCIVLYGPNYGDIVPWNLAQAHRWNIAGFPRGRLLLETQQILMRGLRNTVEEILDGVDRDGSAGKWHQLANTGFNTAAGSESWSVFGNQAFSPPIFDINRLIDISKAHIAEAEDELWLLQTDPAYFQLSVKHFTQSRLVKDDKRLHDWKQNIAMTAWIQPLGQLCSWEWILEEVEHVKAQYLKFRDNINLGDPLPPKFGFALASLELLLINMLQRSVNGLGLLLPRIVAFQDYYIFDRSLPGAVKMTLNAKATGSTKDSFYKDPLFWCLTQM